MKKTQENGQICQFPVYRTVVVNAEAIRFLCHSERKRRIHAPSVLLGNNWVRRFFVATLLRMTLGSIVFHSNNTEIWQLLRRFNLPDKA